MATSTFGSSLPFLLSQVGAKVARDFAERVAATGVSPREFAVLSSVADLGPRTQQQLADSLGMHRTNMGTLVDAMSESGLVRRGSNPRDRRTVLVRLTTEGRRRLAGANRVVPALDAELRAALPRGEADLLLVRLQQLADALGLTPGVHPHLAASYPGERASRVSSAARARSGSPRDR